MFVPAGSNLPFFRIPYFTIAFAVFCVLVFVWFRSTQGGQLHEWSVVPAQHNPFWNYLSYQFLHASWGHLIANVWYLLIFGWILENALGGFTYLSLSVMAGALAVVPEFVFQIDLSLPIVGASGTVAFMMGTVVLLYPFAKIRLFFLLIPLPNTPTHFFVPIRYLVYLWLMLQVSGLAMSAWVSPQPVAYATHLSGFLLGALVALLLRFFWRFPRYHDIELSGRDLKYFYQGLEALKEQRIQEASMRFEHISERQVWAASVQAELLQIAISFRQKSLADSLWPRALPAMAALWKRKELRKLLKDYNLQFNATPPFRATLGDELRRLFSNEPETLALVSSDSKSHS